MAIRQIVRVVVLFVCGLIAAVVLFGFLDSTASISGGWEFGGAFAGFAGTIWILNRVWSDETSFLERAKAAGAEIVYVDVVKVLDLRGSPPNISPQVAPLSNYFLVDRTKDDRDFYMHFSTSGKIEWRGSPTHPKQADWTELGEGEVAIDDGRFASHYKLRIPLDAEPVNVPIPILAEVAYIDAFKGDAKEFLETHIDQATDHLTMIVLIPDEWRADEASVTFHTEGRDRRPLLPPARTLQDGAVVFWAMSRPPEYSRLGLAWTWRVRGGQALAQDTVLPPGVDTA